MKKILMTCVALMMCAMMMADYYMAGDGTETNGWCCGKKWDAAGCKMTNGSYSATVSAGTYQFKVTDGTWTNCWGYSSVNASASTSGYEDGGGNVKFTVASQATISVSFNGSKITLTSTVPFGQATVTSWTVAGVAALMGVDWDPAATANDMALSGGAYTLTRSNVELAAGKYDYKFVANHTWSVKEVPASGNMTLTIDTKGTYDVKFTLDAAGTTGSAVATPVVGKLMVDLTTPIGQYVEQNVSYSIACTATKVATMTLYLDGVSQKSTTGTTMTAPVTFANLGKHTLKLVAVAGEEKDSVSITTTAIAATVEEKRPDGLKMGVTYDKNSPVGVTLCTFAAGCKNANDPSELIPARAVYVLGSFNSWNMNEQYRMKRDGNYFWLKFNVSPNSDVPYQYLVVRSDGKVVKISDLYATRVKEGVSGAEGYTSIIHTQETAYKWSEKTTNFVRPDKNNLVIYELWVYDHTANKNLKGLLSRLDYFSELGVNCIELMPVNEFDGDQSWGYSPNHYFAVDKQYGNPNDLKAFVDSCHGRGIAVVLDMVLNHSTGNNPMNKLYPYGDDLKYNPWFNVTAPHPDNVYEDWNHDFAPTHQMMIDVLKFWMEEYKVDGYRLDLSHGLCGKNYNAVANLKDYYSKAVQPLGGYMMLEHWGTNMGSDRPNLVNAGMMCWENTSSAFFQTGMGWLKDGDDLSNANKDNYVSYPENHDEERTMAAAKMWGNGDLQTSETSRAARVPLNLGFQCMLNGPQLFYHFTEQGFEIAKFQNAAGRYGKNDGGDCAYGKSTCDGSNYKMLPKEAYKMTWTSDTAIHMQAMREVSKIIRLRTRYLSDVFAGNPTSATLTSGQKLRKITWGTDVTVAGNFSATDNQTYYPPSGSTWYDYLAGGVAAQSSYTLKPGEIVVLTGKKISPDPTALENIQADPSSRAKKILVDGQILLDVDGIRYNLLGTKVK